MPMTREEARAALQPNRAHKYGAKAVTVDGIPFASKAEARRFADLRLLERVGEISDLLLQPRYPLTVNGTLVGHYTADFQYVEDGVATVEDVKSSPTRTEAYRLRVKVFKACHPGLRFVETR